MTETLTKAGLAETVSDSVGFTKLETEQIINAIFDTITCTLERGEEVKLSGFGNFVLLDKAERPGRNPKTGEYSSISARRVVTFRPGNKLKDLMRQQNEQQNDA